MELPRDFVMEKLFVSKSPVYGRQFTGYFTRNEIKDLVEEMVQQYGDKDYLRLMVSCNLDIGYRSGKSFNIKSHIQLPDEYEWEYCDGFIVYAWKETHNEPRTTSSSSSATVSSATEINGSVGLDDDENDCLFNSIKEIIGLYRCPKNCKSSATLKQLLGLNRGDKIPLPRIEDIENIMKVNIHLVGQYNYSSKNKYSLNAYLDTTNDHVIPLKNNFKTKDLIVNVPKFQQSLVVYKIDDDIVKCYDGMSVFEMNLDNFYTEKRNRFGKKAYIKCISNCVIKEYHEIIKNTDILKQLHGGRFDLSRSGYKITNEALKCAYYTFMPFITPEPLTPNEHVWIHNSFKGGLIFNQSTTDTQLYEYDINSAYPAMMSDNHFTFPNKQGVFGKIKELPAILSYGIYRVVIEKSNDPHINKLFRFNTLNYYTHIDITTAKKLGLNVILIVDNDYNVLLYTEKRLNGHLVFGEIIRHILYPTKKQSKLAKQIMNSIWGCLCEKQQYKRTTKKDIYLTEEDELTNIEPTGKYHTVEYMKSKKYYKTNYARIGVFLTASVRSKMSLLMLPYKEKIVKCHTDSIVSITELDLPCSDDIGDFKLVEK